MPVLESVAMLGNICLKTRPWPPSKLKGHQFVFVTVWWFHMHALNMPLFQPSIFRGVEGTCSAQGAISLVQMVPVAEKTDALEPRAAFSFRQAGSSDAARSRSERGEGTRGRGGGLLIAIASLLTKVWLIYGQMVLICFKVCPCPRLE